MIGIIGGMGPAAGLDLVAKVHESTLAMRDQDHLDVALLSLPGRIPDRTGFLLGQLADSPGPVIAAIGEQLIDLGASVIGIPCNTSHAPAILADLRRVVDRHPDVEFVHMIECVGCALRSSVSGVSTVGVLGTLGVMQTDVYRETLQAMGFDVLYPATRERRERIHSAIYDEQRGIKALARSGGCNTALEWARSCVMAEIDAMVGEGAGAVVLGCTELPLCVRATDRGSVPLVDPALELARALVHRLAPERLAPR